MCATKSSDLIVNNGCHGFTLNGEVLFAKLKKRRPSAFDWSRIDPSRFAILDLLLIPNVLVPEITQSLLQIGMIWIRDLVDMSVVPTHLPCRSSASALAIQLAFVQPATDSIDHSSESYLFSISRKGSSDSVAC